MQSDPDLALLATENQNLWHGPGGAFAGGAVQDREVYNGCFTTEERLGVQGDWFAKCDLGTAIKKYESQGWDPRLVKFLKITEPDDCYMWNITDLPPLPTWFKKRTVVIGDAAHATLPFMGLVIFTSNLLTFGPAKEWTGSNNKRRRRRELSRMSRSCIQHQRYPSCPLRIRNTSQATM